jgi:hypothetical protein
MYSTPAPVHEFRETNHSIFAQFSPEATVLSSTNLSKSARSTVLSDHPFLITQTDKIQLTEPSHPAGAEFLRQMNRTLKVDCLASRAVSWLAFSSVLPTN